MGVYCEVKCDRLVIKRAIKLSKKRDALDWVLDVISEMEGIVEDLNAVVAPESKVLSGPRFTITIESTDDPPG